MKTETVALKTIDAAPNAAPAPDSAPASVQTIEHWQTAKGTEPWLFAAAKAFRRWGIGSTCNEAEFDAALEQTAGIRVGGART